MVMEKSSIVKNNNFKVILVFTENKICPIQYYTDGQHNFFTLLHACMALGIYIVVGRMAGPEKWWKCTSVKIPYLTM